MRGSTEMQEDDGLWTETWMDILAVLLPSRVALDEVLDRVEAQFPHG